MQRGEVVPSTPCGNCKPARYRQNGIQPDGCVFTTCGRGLRGSGDLRRDSSFVGRQSLADISRSDLKNAVAVCDTAPAKQAYRNA